MATIQKYIQEHGCSRAEAFTLLRDQRNAERGIMSITYPSPDAPVESSNHEVVPVAFYLQVRDRLANELKPYLSIEDLDRVIKHAESGG